MIYSQKPHAEKIVPKKYTIKCTPRNFSLFGKDKNILVLEVFSKNLNKRNQVLTQKYGFISDYDNYAAHITLSYNADDIKLNELPKIDFDIALEKESVKNIEV